MNSISLGPVTVSDVQLLSRDPLPPPENPGAELLVPVTDIDLKAGEYERIRKSSGDVVWIRGGTEVHSSERDGGSGEIYRCSIQDAGQGLKGCRTPGWQDPAGQLFFSATSSRVSARLRASSA